MLAGNSFDYAAIHGEGFMKAKQSFVSTSVQDFLERPDRYNQPIVDIIFGKQRASLRGNDSSTYHFTPFPPEMVSRLSAFVTRGGNLIVSGSNIGSELMESPVDSVSDRLRLFGRVVLGLEPVAPHLETMPRVTTQSYWASDLQGRLPLSIEPNAAIYAIQRGEAMTPAINAATSNAGDYVEEIALFQSGHTAAYALHRDDKGDVVMAGFPIEAITDREARINFIAGALKFLDVVPQPIAPRYDTPLPKIDPIPTRDPSLPKPGPAAIEIVAK